MMQRLALSSLYAVPALLALACSPMDLTVGEKEPSAGKAGGSSTNDKTSGVIPGKGEGDDDQPSAGGAASDPGKDPGQDPPATSFFSCKDGTKIDAALRCSGSKECPDGSDEVSCPPPPFVCKAGQEIDAALVCDGAYDCADESDELDCPEPPFICANGTAIYRGLVCDGKDECGDGSDELGCSDSCEAGVDFAIRFEPINKCWLPQERIGCAQLIQPDLSVPDAWPDTQCLVRKKDSAIFFVPEPQLQSEWDECSPAQLQLTALAAPCP